MKYKTKGKLQQEIKFIRSCFRHPDKPLHWVSADGFIAITGAPFERQDIIGSLGHIFEHKYVSLYSYSTLVHNKKSQSLFYYVPLFKKRYWQNIYNIKASLPIVQKNYQRYNISSDHVYQMLLNKPLIPSLEELVMFYQQYQLGVDDIPFDYSYWFEKVPDIEKFMKAVNWYNSPLREKKVWQTNHRMIQCLQTLKK